MTLQNAAQNKEFVTAEVSQSRQVKTRKFFWQEKTKTKTLPETREIPSRQFHSQSFSESRPATGLNAKTAWKSDLVFRTQMAADGRVAADRNKKVIGHDFADNHPFRFQGKSQNALSQRDRPLTIEEVRELLNKNQ
jgi:hypothetical protein